MYGRIARVFGRAREFDARESTKERTSAGGMLSLSQSLSVRAPVNLRRESRASRGESRRKTISHAWGTRSRAAERANGPDERYYEEMAWGDGAVRTASEDGEAESCPLDLHDERASNFEAVMLVVGTTVGGGFLAMPYFAAPTGFLPAVMMSVGAWAVLAASGLMVAETLMHTWARSSGRAVSLLSATTEYLGKKWGFIAAVSFFVMMNCTLVSQLAKCGALAYFFSNGAVSHMSGAAMTAATIGAVSFSRMAAKVNAYATVGIFVSFTAICVFGMANLAPSNLAFMNFAAALPALPGLFQLYTYGECLPTLVDMLRGDRRRIRRVILTGTTVPLLMYTAWLFVALAQNGSWASSADLAQSMLESGGVLGAATASVAIAASISTLIGGYLALSRFCADALRKKTVAHSKSVISLTLLPSLFFAFKGPEVYFSALQFSGAVVVIILWGILPPLMAKALWTREGRFDEIKKSLVYVWTSVASVALGFGVRSVVYA